MLLEKQVSDQCESTNLMLSVPLNNSPYNKPCVQTYPSSYYLLENASSGTIHHFPLSESYTKGICGPSSVPDESFRPFENQLFPANAAFSDNRNICNFGDFNSSAKYP